MLFVIFKLFKNNFLYTDNLKYIIACDCFSPFCNDAQKKEYDHDGIWNLTGMNEN